MLSPARQSPLRERANGHPNQRSPFPLIHPQLRQRDGIPHLSIRNLAVQHRTALLGSLGGSRDREADRSRTRIRSSLRDQEAESTLLTTVQTRTFSCNLCGSRALYPCTVQDGCWT